MFKKTNKLLLFLAPFFLTVLLFITSFSLFEPKTKQQLVSPNLTQVASFSANNPPSASQKGVITSLSGDVFWQSRTATTSAKISEIQQIQQGEQLKTGDNGSIKVDFPAAGVLDILAKSQLNIVQTLPANYVFAQSDGTIEYKSTGDFPFSIRAMHLLVENSHSDIIITSNNDQKTLILSVKEGSASTAFNDTDLVSQEINIPAGKKYIFDDQTREGTLKSL